MIATTRGDGVTRSRRSTRTSERTRAAVPGRSAPGRRRRPPPPARRPRRAACACGHLASHVAIASAWAGRPLRDAASRARRRAVGGLRRRRSRSSRPPGRRARARRSSEPRGFGFGFAVAFTGSPAVASSGEGTWIRGAGRPSSSSAATPSPASAGRASCGRARHASLAASASSSAAPSAEGSSASGVSASASDSSTTSATGSILEAAIDLRDLRDLLGLHRDRLLLAGARARRLLRLGLERDRRSGCDRRPRAPAKAVPSSTRPTVAVTFLPTSFAAPETTTS